jgi:hypothetical protein
MKAEPRITDALRRDFRKQERPENAPRRWPAEKVADALEAYNGWRRGGPGEQPSPALLGEVIERAVVLLRDRKNTKTRKAVK